MREKKLKISLLPQRFAICYFAKRTPIPAWAKEGEWFSITRTDQELSIVFPEDKVPAGVLAEKGWRAIRLEGMVDGVYAPGIIASLSMPLAKEKISIFNISTYQTNYIFLEEKNLKKGLKILENFCQIVQ